MNTIISYRLDEQSMIKVEENQQGFLLGWGKSAFGKAIGWTSDLAHIGKKLLETDPSVAVRVKSLQNFFAFAFSYSAIDSP